MRERGQVSRALEVLLVDVVAQLRGELEELGEFDFVVCVLEDGDQSLLPQAVLRDVYAPGTDELFELFDQALSVVGEAAGLAVEVSDGIVSDGWSGHVVIEGLPRG